MRKRRPHQILSKGAGRMRLFLHILHNTFARGKSRSGTISQLTEMARAAADEGGKEIVITGVNIGDFGKIQARLFRSHQKASTKSKV